MKTLKALLVNGSPRANGCTFTALTELKKTLEAEGIEVELIHVGHRDVLGRKSLGLPEKEAAIFTSFHR